MTCIQYVLAPVLYLIYILSALFYLIYLLTAGFDTKDLGLHPTDQHLVRLAGLVAVDKFYEFVIHLGLPINSWNIILKDYQGYHLTIVHFLALCKWRQQKYKDMETASFKDLSVALTAINHHPHVLCQVGNN